MITLTVKWDVKPEYADDFMALIADLSATCRAEPGCLWFEWSRSPDDPDAYVLVESYAGVAAVIDHVRTGHFRAAWRLQKRFAISRPTLLAGELRRRAGSPVPDPSGPRTD